ncbi:MAG: hypothetical protein EA403_04635 [Spirochaetaceae bacterium]|nr:MAG: hypothetical protein EA403_04635 [Spirochaetaceae bacterium]
MINHRRVRKIEDHLVSGEGRCPSGNLERPLRMGAIEIAVGADHLRLNPDTKLQPRPVYGLSHRT